VIGDSVPLASGSVGERRATELAGRAGGAFRIFLICTSAPVGRQMTKSEKNPGGVVPGLAQRLYVAVVLNIGKTRHGHFAIGYGIPTMDECFQ